MSLVTQEEVDCVIASISKAGFNPCALTPEFIRLQEMMQQAMQDFFASQPEDGDWRLSFAILCHGPPLVVGNHDVLTRYTDVPCDQRLEIRCEDAIGMETVESIHAALCANTPIIMFGDTAVYCAVLVLHVCYGMTIHGAISKISSKWSVASFDARPDLLCQLCFLHTRSDDTSAKMEIDSQPAPSSTSSYVITYKKTEIEGALRAAIDIFEPFGAVVPDDIPETFTFEETKRNTRYADYLDVLRGYNNYLFEPSEESQGAFKVAANKVFGLQ